MGNISKHFNRAEFACKCGCGYDDISGRFLNILDDIRDLIDRPLVITSGCRCQEYNKKVGGKKYSAHTKGLAVDLNAVSSVERFEIVQALVAFKVSRVGIGKDFVHIDIDQSKPQQVIWLY